MSNKIKNKLDYNDVMDLTSEITFKLQDLKLIKGNNKNYNFEIDDEMRTIICKKLNIGEEQMSSEKKKANQKIVKAVAEIQKIYDIVDEIKDKDEKKIIHHLFQDLSDKLLDNVQEDK